MKRGKDQSHWRVGSQELCISTMGYSDDEHQNNIKTISKQWMLPNACQLSNNFECAWFLVVIEWDFNIKQWLNRYAHHLFQVGWTLYRLISFYNLLVCYLYHSVMRIYLRAGSWIHWLLLWLMWNAAIYNKGVEAKHHHQIRHNGAENGISPQ